MSGLEPNDKAVTEMGIPDGCILKNYNLLTEHLFHALTQGQSMYDLKVSVSKGKTVAIMGVPQPIY